MPVRVAKASSHASRFREGSAAKATPPKTGTLTEFMQLGKLVRRLLEQSGAAAQPEFSARTSGYYFFGSAKTM